MTSPIKKFIPNRIWRWLRLQSIILSHRKCSRICQELIDDFYADNGHDKPKAKKIFETDKIIWQYWAQGYDRLPETVRKCIDSVDKYSGEYTVIRLTDANLEEYLDIPEYITEKRAVYSYAFFSDLLRVMLLSVYGGLWLDATVFLSGQIPQEYADYDFFLFQRDPLEPNKDYWENVYAYYYCWRKEFRVNMLSSIFFAKKGSEVVSSLASLMMKWWREHDDVPDYFFLQILFDVLIKGKYAGMNCPIVSDCKPHYLQQSINDPKFSIMDRETILSTIPMHKLTYKK